MSEENVELVRRTYEAATRHDVEAVLDVYTQDAEWHMRGPWLEEPVYRGREEIRHFLDSWFATFGEQSFLLDQFEYFEVEDQVVVIGKQHIGASGGGPVIDQEFGQVLTFDQGRVRRSEIFQTGREALEAVGLRD
jgi:ketosteroid isomerase-like protein